MKIVIAGGTGFLGQPLAARLAGDGHEIVILTRHGPARKSRSLAARLVEWNPDGSIGPWRSEIDGAGTVINLAGESIAARKWTPQQKLRIHDSRVLATRSLVDAMKRAGSPPSVFLSGSATGYYGPLGDEIVAEERGPGSDFLASVCVDWEKEAMRAGGSAIRVVTVRTGLVLERDGGALPRMLPPFWFGVGGKVGSGRQYWPWIHRRDWIDLVRWTIRTPSVSGPINVTAPTPVTNADFARALGRAMRRPAFVPTPAFALKIALGEMADALVLSGQRAVPAKAERFGFGFAYTEIGSALDSLFNRQFS
jgi:uncharacterized protein (TIGR01777 family)